jgi:hypothetical protein
MRAFLEVAQPPGKTRGPARTEWNPWCYRLCSKCWNRLWLMWKRSSLNQLSLPFQQCPFPSPLLQPSKPRFAALVWRITFEDESGFFVSGVSERNYLVALASLEAFYLELVRLARSQSISCAVTSGMACVALGIAPATSDCDLLLRSSDCSSFLDLIAGQQFRGEGIRYRGNLSPPLSAEWLSGGWTAHFQWGSEAYLDVFAEAPRVEHDWATDIEGFYVGPLTVAAMKKTDREKDWPQVTALGLKLLEAGDTRGWLSLHNEQLLLEMLDIADCPPGILARRPVLELAQSRDPRLHAALVAEQLYWRELDRIRMATYQSAARPYCAALRAGFLESRIFADEHVRRVDLAAALLPPKPMRQLGLEPFVERARARVGTIVQPELLFFLPDVRECFRGICL